MGVKLPVAVSTGDRLEVPLTLASEVDRPLTVRLESTLGEGLVAAEPLPTSASLAPGARDSRN